MIPRDQRSPSGRLEPSAARRPPPPSNTVALDRVGVRRKVVLKQGRSPLDWAALQRSGANLRGIVSSGPLRITQQELARHNTRQDAWTSLQGKVYNISPYVEYHPGGESTLLQCAGREGTELFMKTHAWVNYTHMLEQCFIGFYVG